jgi:hypothetical protein
MLNLSSLFTIYCSDYGPSHTFFSLCEQWNYPDSQVRMVVPNCAPSCRRQNLVEAVPRSGGVTTRPKPRRGKD